MKKLIFLAAIFSIFFVYGSEANYPARLVKGKSGMVLEINGKRCYPHASRFLWNWSGKGEKVYLAEPAPVKEFSKQGVKIAFVGTELGWRPEGKYDYTHVDKMIGKALEDPSVYIIPAIDMRWETVWWQRVNPGERFMRIVKGKIEPRNGGSTTASFFSDKFRDEASEAVRNYIKHIEEKKWAHRVIGYQINWGRAAEWIAWEHLSDLNPHAISKFREYLKVKYRNDTAALRKAWKDETVDFSTAYPAGNMLRTADKDGYINDPAEGRKIPDYVEFYRQRTTDMLLHFMKVIKDATANKALAGTYASPGYYYQEFDRIAVSDQIDFCVSSAFYNNRSIIGTSLTQAVSCETFRKNNKLYWHDADARTHIWESEHYRGSKNVYESLMAALRREFGGIFVKQMGLTWFSLNPAANVFDNKAIMEDINRMRAICDSAVQLDADFSGNAQVAIVYEPARVFSSPYRSTAPIFINYIQMGVPVDFYPLYDLKHLAKVKKQYKLVVLLGCGTLTEKQRDWIKSLQSDQRTLLFMYANGIVKGDKFSTAYASELSGFKYEFLPTAEQKINILPAWQQKFGISMPLLGQINAPSGARRLCIIPSANDNIIAVNAKDGKAAWAIRQYPDWTAIQFPGYQTYSGVLLEIAKSAGVKINYPYTDATCQACREFICVTGGVGGTRQLMLSDKVIYDIFSDKIIKSADGKFNIQFLPGETKLFFTGNMARVQQFRKVYQENLSKRGKQ